MEGALAMPYPSWDPGSAARRVVHRAIPGVRRVIRGARTVAAQLHVDERDVLAAAPEEPSQERSGPYRLNWVLPRGYPGAGGHTNVLRFVNLLAERGHQSTVFVYAPGHRISDRTAVHSLIDGLPPIEADIRPLPDRLPPADGHIATAWQTAYAVAARSGPGRRLYWVQDYEPWFHPHGTERALAEHSYELGLRAITLGPGLRDVLTSKHGVDAEFYDFGFDPAVYAGSGVDRAAEVCFFARPFTPRRGFELGILALTELHRRAPSVPIHLFGDALDGWRLPFPARHHGTLTPHALATLYQRCRAGLVLSFTNTSFAPLEMLAAGCTPVVNDAPINRSALGGAGVTFTPADPAAIADRLHALVQGRDNAPPVPRAEPLAAKTWPQICDQVEDALHRHLGE